MNIVWLLARLAFWIFYRVERIGALVPDGPLLLVANHPNVLLDPAVIRATANRDIRFLAKAGLFHDNPLSPFMRWAGAIPVHRRIDGADMSQNLEMFAAVEAALAQGAAIALFPEGLSHSTGRLEQLRTGAARMALASAAREVPVAIQAVGLNFDDKAIFRSRLTVSYGRPFSCDEFLEGYRRAGPEAVRALTDRIGERLRELLVEADPRSDAQLVERVDTLYAAARRTSDAPEDRLQRRRIISAGIERLRARAPDQYQAIRENLRQYDAALARFGLRDPDVGRTVGRRAVLRFVLRESVLALVLVPLSILGLLLFAVPYRVTDWIAARWRDRLESHARAKVLGGIVAYGLWVVLLTVVAGLWGGVRVGAATFIGLPVLATAALFAIERETGVVGTIRAYAAARQTPMTARSRLLRRRSEMVEVLERVRSWLEDDRDGRAMASHSAERWQ